MLCNCIQHIPKLCPGLRIITVITGIIISGRTSGLSDTSNTTGPFNKQAAENVTKSLRHSFLNKCLLPSKSQKDFTGRCKNGLVTRCTGCNNNALYKLIQQSQHDCKTNKLTISRLTIRILFISG